MKTNTEGCKLIEFRHKNLALDICSFESLSPSYTSFRKASNYNPIRVCK